MLNFCHPVLFIPVACFENAAMDEERLIGEVEMTSCLCDTSSFHYENKVAAGCRETARRSPESLLLAVDYIVCYFHEISQY